MADLPTVTSQVAGSMPGSLSETLKQAFESAKRGDYTLVIDTAVPVLAKGALSICVFIACYFLARILGRAVTSALCTRLDETLGKFVGRFTFYGVLLCASLGILGSIGVNVASAAAILTAAGFAIGLAFQGTLSNFAAGVLLMVFRPFRVGDSITAGGVSGKVNEIDLFTTTLDTGDNRRLIVPNSAIAGSTIENMTHHPHRRVEVQVGVEYTADMQTTRGVLCDAAEDLREFLVAGEDRGYKVSIMNLGASSVEWAVLFWCPTNDVGKVKELLTETIKLRLDQAGIGIPFPQLSLHLKERSTDSDTTSGGLLVKPRLRNPLSNAG